MPPANYQRLRLESACARLGLTANLQQITLFVTEARTILSQSVENGRPINIQELFDEVRSQLQEKEKHIPYKRVANTLLQSGSLQSIDGQQVKALNDERPLHPLPQNGVIIQKCAMLLKQQISQPTL
jgi:hypothetical protein